MIDLHCHLLPGLDDGPADMGASLQLARMSAARGTRTIVATPHIDHRWGVRPVEIPRRASIIADALEREGIELEILASGEIALSRLADLSAEELRSLHLGNGPYVLLECPLNPNEGDFDVLLLKIRERGQQILLAHPERCPAFQREPERLVRCVEAGMLCSITAGAARGDFGARVRQFTIDILRAGLVHNIASDSHDHVRRPPGLRSAVQAVEPEIEGIGKQTEWLTTLVPAAILAGEPLPSRPPLSDRH